MSITLAKILLATDGSKDAVLAARAAMDLSNRTGAELHVVHARQDVRLAGIPPTVTQDEYTRALERWEQEDREFLEEQAERLRSAGGTVAGAHLKNGRPADVMVLLQPSVQYSGQRETQTKEASHAVYPVRQYGNSTRWVHKTRWATLALSSVPAALYRTVDQRLFAMLLLGRVGCPGYQMVLTLPIELR